MNTNPPPIIELAILTQVTRSPISQARIFVAYTVSETLVANIATIVCMLVTEFYRNIHWSLWALL